MERGDLAEFGKKRITDHDFPPPVYVGRKVYVGSKKVPHINKVKASTHQVCQFFTNT